MRRIAIVGAGQAGLQVALSLQVLAPGVLLGIVVLCVYRVGDGLRDRMSSGVLETKGIEDDVIIA